MSSAIMQGVWTTVAGLVLYFLAGVEGRKIGAAERYVAVANNEFGRRLYQELIGEPGNMLFSPLSAHAVLSMAYAGAGGATARELAEGLSLQLQDRAQVEAGYQALMTEFKNANGNITIDIANKIYLDVSAEMKSVYRTSVQQNFLSEAQKLNFGGNPEEARKSINEWVERKTRNKIRNLLPTGSVNSDTLMILVNTLYFNGEWDIPFPSDKTIPDNFNLKSLVAKRIDMMNVKDVFPYAEMDEFKVLQMDYVGGDFSMLVLLPKEIDGVAKLEASVPTLDWGDIDRKLSTPTMVDVYLPRFKLEKQMDLADTLRKIRISSAFGPGADFSGITDADVYASKVSQKAFLAVTEKGTTAGAVTVVALENKSAFGPPPVFRADHPFIFLLYHKPSAAVLFLGRFSGPE